MRKFALQKLPLHALNRPSLHGILRAPAVHGREFSRERQGAHRAGGQKRRGQIDAPAPHRWGNAADGRYHRKAQWPENRLLAAGDGTEQPPHAH